MQKIKLVQFSDIHIGSPFSFRYQPAWRENFFNAIRQMYEEVGVPDALIISGDLTRDGETHEFELRQVKEIFNSFEFPVLFIPGNHDVGGRVHPTLMESINENKWQQYIKVFGSDNFEHEIDSLRLVGFNSFLMGSNIQAEEELWSWLEKKIKEKKDHWKHQIWFMHTPPYHKKPFEATDVTYEQDAGLWYCYLPLKAQHRLLNLFKENGIHTIASGHIHCFQDEVVDGFRKIICPSTAFCHPTKQLGFLSYEIGEKIDVSYHQLKVISTIEGYGDGGHFAISDRDYSVAKRSSPEISKEIEEMQKL